MVAPGGHKNILAAFIVAGFEYQLDQMDRHVAECGARVLG
jgi:hypothetical protein